MKSMKVLAAAAGLMVCGSVMATPSVTGFFIGADFGGAYNQFKEGWRKKDGKKADQIDFIDVHKNGVYVGGHVGYYYEFGCGFVLGGELAYSYDFSKIKHKDDATISGLKIVKDGTTHDLGGTYTLEAKPQHTYGFHLHLGGKMMPNFLAYLSLGVEGNTVSISQQLNLVTSGGTNGWIFANGDFTKVDGTTVNGVKVTTTSESKTDKASVTYVRFVPGLGVKYFLNSGLYVGGDVRLPIGWNRKVDEKYLAEGADFTHGDASVAGVKIDSIKTLGNLYANSRLGVRYGISLGYKF